MQLVDKRICAFIKKHHVFTLATSNKGQPWCASCFYVWDTDESIFIYSTDFTTKHGIEALENENVAANIYLETPIISKIKGLQIKGKTFPVQENFLKKARSLYLKRFPYAIIMDLQLWKLQPDNMKLTDNNFGFGKKLIWER